MRPTRTPPGRGREYTFGAKRQGAGPAHRSYDTVALRRNRTPSLPASQSLLSSHPTASSTCTTQVPHWPPPLQFVICRGRRAKGASGKQIGACHPLPRPEGSIGFPVRASGASALMMERWVPPHTHSDHVTARWHPVRRSIGREASWGLICTNPSPTIEQPLQPLPLANLFRPPPPEG